MSLSNVPEKIVSGDTVRFTVSSDVIPEDKELVGASLSISFRGASGFVIETEQIDQSTGHFEFDFQANDWRKGWFDWTAYISDNSQRYTLGNGRTLVLPDPSSTTISKSHAEQVLEAIEAAIEGTATDPQMMMSINGRMIQRYGISDLLKFRGIYKREVASERKSMGYGNRDKIRIQFNNRGIE